MKSTIQRALFAVAVTTLGAGAVGTASAQSAPSSAPTAGAHHGHHHFGFGGSPFLGTFLRAVHQLNSTPGTALSTTQQATLKTLLQEARQAHSHSQSTPEITVIGDPSPKNSGAYSEAVTAAISAASARITEDSTLATQIYTALNLTPAQQTQLQTILTSEQAQAQARRAQWAAKHAAGTG